MQIKYDVHLWAKQKNELKYLINEALEQKKVQKSWYNCFEALARHVIKNFRLTCILFRTFSIDQYSRKTSPVKTSAFLDRTYINGDILSQGPSSGC